MGNQRTTILHDKNGKELIVPVRSAQPVTAAGARYTGFKQETLILKKGSIRLKGYLHYHAILFSSEMFPSNFVMA